MSSSEAAGNPVIEAINDQSHNEVENDDHDYNFILPAELERELAAAMSDMGVTADSFDKEPAKDYPEIPPPGTTMQHAENAYEYMVWLTSMFLKSEEKVRLLTSGFQIMMEDMATFKRDVLLDLRSACHVRPDDLEEACFYHYTKELLKCYTKADIISILEQRLSNYPDPYLRLHFLTREKLRIATIIKDFDPSVASQTFHLPQLDEAEEKQLKCLPLNLKTTKLQELQQEVQTTYLEEPEIIYHDMWMAFKKVEGGRVQQLQKVLQKLTAMQQEANLGNIGKKLSVKLGDDDNLTWFLHDVIQESTGGAAKSRGKLQMKSLIKFK